MTPAARIAVRDVPLRALGADVLATWLPGDGTASAGDVLYLRVGDPPPDRPLLTRIHSSCLPGEVFGSTRCDCGWQLRHAFESIVAAGAGAVVYLPRHDGRGAGLATLLRSYSLMDSGMTSAQAFETLGQPPDARGYAHAVAALRAFNVSSVALITNNPAKITAVEAGGVRVAERVPTVMPTADGALLRLLRSKADDFGHLIDRSTP